MTTASETKSAATRPKSDFDQIRDDLQAIREDFRSLASNTAKLAASHVQEQSKRASALAGAAAEKAGDYRDLISDKIKDRPLASVGAAILVGLVMSSMRRR
jgi:ElaB/YqjD/DUF883 family membrane-anchored ribosome-binding protein